MGASKEEVTTISVVNLPDYRSATNLGSSLKSVELSIGDDDLNSIGKSTMTINSHDDRIRNTENQSSMSSSPTTPENRDSWGSGMEFLMSCIALSVGLGNVWRFPFAALDNGGGAFLIPYLVVLLLVGKPIYYMEMILGQFSTRGSIHVYDMVPLMRGIGYGQVFASAMITSYYAALLALITRYFIASFSAVLPWSECRPEWRAQGCIDSGTSQNRTVYADAVTQVMPGQSSAEMYFYKEVLRETDNINDGIGDPDWKLVIALIFSWICVGVILFKGIRSSGKMSYFLALFPYVTMGALLVRAVTLPGSSAGIMYLLTPQWAELLNPHVWFAAVSQVFFSISVCLGLIIMFSSFNRFDHNIYRDAMIVTTLDTVTSILSGVTIFGILGNLAHETGATDIRKVVQGGSGLAFVSYPDAIAKFTWMPQIFSVLFFFMLFVLGIGTNVGLCVCLTSVLRDRFKKLTPVMAISSVAGVQFCIGLMYVTPGGQFLLNIIDYNAVTMVVYILAIAELITVSWLYGVDRLCGDVEFMLGMKTGFYWRICWAVITPGLMMTIIVYQFVTIEPLQYNGKSYPDYVYVIGWLLTLCGVLPTLLIAIATIYHSDGKTFGEKLRNTLRPAVSWGPSDPSLNAKYKTYMQDREAADEITGANKGWSNRIKRNLFGKQNTKL